MKLVQTFLMAAMLTWPSQAANPPTEVLPPPKVEEVEPKKAPKEVNAEYKEVIDKTTSWVKGVTDKDFYKDLTFKNKKTGEKKKIDDLPTFDRDLFYLTQIEKLNDEIETVKAAWRDRFGKYDALKDDAKKALPDKDTLESYGDQMHFWHRKLAIKHKTHAEYLFKTYKDNFTKEDVEAYMKKMEEYQKKHKLGDEK
jgi:hypothetical protein